MTRSRPPGVAHILPLPIQFRESRMTDFARPNPLYLSTAAQLGLEQTRGVPSLLDNVLPKEVRPAVESKHAHLGVSSAGTESGEMRDVRASRV